LNESHIWIDEVDLDKFFQKEPTPAEVMARFGYWEPTANGKMIGAEASTWKRANDDRLRRLVKNRRTKEQQNCLHGRRLFEINWAPGIHPLGPREFWVNIAGMGGGPYLLNDADHEILHSVNRDHEHVRTRHIKRSEF
jgi:hypothetical protein